MDTKTSIFAVQRSAERAHFDHGWLDTYHSFSFAEYMDPKNANWGVLRVFNDDRVAPGAGFPTHPHRDMEILTYVLGGELEHQDSMGNHGVVRPGGVQYMSAGTGVRHSEFNHSKERELHFVQMWVLPAFAGLAPQYGQRDFAQSERTGRWLHVASGVEGVESPIRLGQAAALYVARLDGQSLSHSFAEGRLGFFFVADGEVQANGETLGTGDAVRIANVPQLEVEGSGEVLLWDLAPVA